MRTNYEDDLRASGRLGKVARVMGWRENATLGQLIFFYRATQKAKIAVAEMEEILDIASVEFDSRDEARQFVVAMQEAQLVSSTSDDQLEIHGNQQQINERRGYLRGSKRRASNGGKKRAALASRREDGTFRPAGDQPETSQGTSDDPAIPGIPAPAPAPAPAPQIQIQIQNTAPLSVEDDEPRKREIRNTRGFLEAAFEAAFRERSPAVTVAKFDNLELSIGGKLIKRCGAEGITQAQLLAEWWRDEWRTWHGFTVKDLDKHFAKVRAAIADPKLRPKLDNAEAKPTRARGPSADATEQKLKAERDALASETFVDPEEASRRFAAMRRLAGGR